MFSEETMRELRQMVRAAFAVFFTIIIIVLPMATSPTVGNRAVSGVLLALGPVIFVVLYTGLGLFE